MKILSRTFSTTLLSARFYLGQLFLIVVLMHTTLCFAQPTAHQEGIAAGQAGNIDAAGRVTQSSAAGVVPGYGQTPSEIGITAEGITAANQARTQLCRSRPKDPVCQGILTGQISASNPRPAVSPLDASVNGARSIANDPYKLVNNLTTSYAACKPTTATVSPAIYDTQSCHTYYLRELDQACSKTLTVKVDYSCAAGLDGPSTIANGVTTCSDRKTGSVTPASVAERDVWQSDCVELESRVPAGLLPPDGTNTVGQGSSVGDVLNKCERKASVCTEPDVTKTINGRDVTRACWQYQNLFDCVSNNVVTDCDQTQTGQCQKPGLTTCTDTSIVFQNSVCTAFRTDLKCLVKDAVTRPSTTCAGQQYCLGANCFDASYTNDPDFARSVSLLEANRQGGKYLDASNMRLFKGFDNRCVKKLFGLVNCCSKGGSGAAASFANLAILLASASAGGGASASGYTYDGLFAADASSFVMSGFGSMLSGGGAAFAGLLGGELSVSSFMISLVPGPWTLAILAIQYSGILSCPEKQKVIAMKRDANLCITVGSYCSKRFPIIRSCMEQTTTFCCFNSKLARILNTAGKGQLGQAVGSPESPNCDGFTAAEFQKLDFSKIDLSEFYADITPKTADLKALTDRVNQNSASCIDGQGNCKPVGQPGQSARLPIRQ